MSQPSPCNWPCRLALLTLFLVAALAPAFGQAAEPVDLTMVGRIRQEGFRNSKVMDTMSELSDRLGPRLTGSPYLKKANEWTRDQLTSWGLVNAHLEAWGPFGRGWETDFASVRMVAPQTALFYAIPEAWTPGTNGAVRGPAVQVIAKSEKDLEKYKGQLAGKIVLLGEMREVKPQEKAAAQRFDDAKLADLARYTIPGGKPPYNLEEIAERIRFRKVLNQFLADEKAAAILEPSRGDGGTIFVQGGGSYKRDEPAGPPALMMAIEHYGRVSRLLERKEPVEIEVNVQNQFFDDDPMAYNTVAEIPGTDKKDEIVMLGGHLDSWHGGTGATDDGAGVGVAMEAVRILKALGVKPRRTIRIVLWTGEEQGVYGSKAYVKEHFGSRPSLSESKIKDAPEWMRHSCGPLQLKPDAAKVAAYFNLDNGTGKIRGIYLQENGAVRPIFQSWMTPLEDLGVTTLTMDNTGGTDHLSLDAVGIPAFQFIQDPVEYMSRTHHSNMDVYERLQREDMAQASVVMATFVYNAAMRDQMLPRKAVQQDIPCVAPPQAGADY